MDTDRLAVAWDGAVHDADVVAGLVHLLGRLGEAAFVAVGGRQAEEPWQPECQAEQDEDGGVADFRHGHAPRIEPACAHRPARDSPDKSFLLLFLEKEDLSFSF